MSATAWIRSLALVATAGLHTGVPEAPSANLLQEIEAAASRVVQPAKPITPEQLVRVRDIAGHSGVLSISPDLRSGAFVLQQADPETNMHRREWYVLPLQPSGSPVYAGDAGPPRLGKTTDGRTVGYHLEPEVRWSPDSRSIAYLRGATGSEQIWLSTAAGGEAKQLTRSDGEILEFNWSRDGSRLYYETGRSGAERERADAAEARRGYLFDDRFWPDYGTRPVWSACEPDKVFGIPKPVSQPCTRSLWTLQLRTLSAAAATEAEAREFAALRSADADSSSRATARSSSVGGGEPAMLAWLQNADPEKYRGFAPPRSVYASSARPPWPPQVCSASACTGAIEDVWVDGSKSTVIFLRAEGHARSEKALYEWAPATNAVRTIYRTGEHISQCSLIPQRLICLHEAPTRARAIISIDTASGRLETLFDPNPEFARISFTTVEKLEWHDGFGNPTYGHLVYPVGFKPGQRFPLVVVQYRSRGFLRGGVGDEYPIHVFAANRFFVLSFNAPEDQALRERHPIEEHEARDWADLYERRRSFQALENVVDLLETRALISDRIGITGLSEGAESVNFTLAHTDRFAAASASDSIWSPHLTYLSNSWVRDYLARHIGSPSDLQRWRELSIGMRAKAVRTPLLLQVADRELIPSLFNYRSLQDAGRVVEMHVFPSEFHNKWQPAHRLNIYRRNLQWFRFWLQDIEEAEPVDPEQYIRWRALRTRQAAERTGR